jgi:hypothetical protein
LESAIFRKNGSTKKWEREFKSKPNARPGVLLSGTQNTLQNSPTAKNMGIGSRLVDSRPF